MIKIESNIKQSSGKEDSEEVAFVFWMKEDAGLDQVSAEWTAELPRILRAVVAFTGRKQEWGVQSNPKLPSRAQDQPDRKKGGSHFRGTP